MVKTNSSIGGISSEDIVKNPPTLIPGVHAVIGDPIPFSGTGSSGTTTSGTGSTEIKTALPTETKVPFTDPQTGRRTGVGFVGGRSFFVTGSDLALLQSQLSGSSATNNTTQQMDADQQNFKNAQAIAQINAEQNRQFADLTSQFTGGPELTQAEKLGQSGLLAVQGLPLPKTAKFILSRLPKDSKIAMGLGAAWHILGSRQISILGTSVGGSANSIIFGDTAKTVSELEGDAREFEVASKAVLAQVKDGDIDADLALSRLDVLEQGISKRYNDANLMLAKNPDAVRQGLDTTEDLLNAKSLIQTRRFAVLRYKISRDPSEIQNIVNTFVMSDNGL